ncbi:murein L,D-transpeptidase family protein [Candidatus Latescibacterota bacterium]
MSRWFDSNKIFLYMVMLAVLGILLFKAGGLAGEEAQSDLELLRKVSANYINEVIESADNLDDAAKNAGITVEELRRLCRSLSISLEKFEVAIDPYSLPTVQKLASTEYEPDVVVNYNWHTPYILLVEKSNHKIYLLKYENGAKTLIGIYDCKTGKNKGDKREEGDHKTPEGIFFLQNKYTRADIQKLVGRSKSFQYGEMAFTTDFPNNIDQLNGKNGSGIWLHGTDEPFSETSPLDTRGCVVTTNETIKVLNNYISLRRTPIIIVEDLVFNTKAEHAAKQQELLELLEDWRSSWEAKRLDEYIGHYSEKFQSSGRNRSQLRTYKSAIFNAHTINHIKIDTIILLKHNGGMIAKFNQDYSASNYKAKNIKELYFVKNNDSWDIIAERTTN